MPGGTFTMLTILMVIAGVVLLVKNIVWPPRKPTWWDYRDDL